MRDDGGVYVCVCASSVGVSLFIVGEINKRNIFD